MHIRRDSSYFLLNANCKAKKEDKQHYRDECIYRQISIHAKLWISIGVFKVCPSSPKTTICPLVEHHLLAYDNPICVGLNIFIHINHKHYKNFLLISYILKINTACCFILFWIKHGKVHYINNPHIKLGHTATKTQLPGISWYKSFTTFKN